MKLMSTVVLAIFFCASVAYPDTMPTATSTSDETITELAIIGNDITFANVTPDSLQAAIDAWLAPYAYVSFITTADEYQANFYADGSAFLFRIPNGTVDPPDEITTTAAIATPEPSEWPMLLTGLGLFLCYTRKRW